MSRLVSFKFFFVALYSADHFIFLSSCKFPVRITSCHSCLDDAELALLGVPWENYVSIAAKIGLDVIR